MFAAKAHRSVASVILGVACIALPSVSLAATPVKLSGAITGIVRDTGGIPQMGATVFLYNRQDKIFEKALTDIWGEFRFFSLVPNVYSIRVSLTSFMPAIKRDILVQPGMRSVLNVNLASLFSTIQLAYPAAEAGGLMTDEWKWVLRSSSTTRPITRFLDRPGQVSSRSTHTATFSDTRGIVRVSAGEGPLATGIGNEAALGTTFAVATSVGGNSTLQVAGNFGYGSESGVPAAAFRTSYSRSIAAGSDQRPEVSLTMRQLFLPARWGTGLTGSEAAMPVMRTISAGYADRLELSDNATLDYGSNMDSVTFLEHTNYFSPYARLTYSLSEGEDLAFAFTSGNARPDLGREDTVDSDLKHGLDNLGVFPNVTLRGGRPRIQRGQEMEVTYSRQAGSRKFYLSAYRESVANAALSIVAPAGLYAGGDIMPDLFSGSSMFNAGDFQTAGYTAAITQNLGEHVSVTVMYGSMGALTVENRELVSQNPDELRSMIHAGRKHAGTTRISATVPKAGTHLVASYQWASDNRWAAPGNVYSTQALRSAPGLNIYIRQPLPMPVSLPWRMEATADLRNMLAQGYLPLNMANGQSVLLVETPRSVRGGLSFIF